MQGKFVVLILILNSGKGKARERAIDFAENWKNALGTELRLRPTKR